MTYLTLRPYGLDTWPVTCRLTYMETKSTAARTTIASNAAFILRQPNTDTDREALWEIVLRGKV